MSHVPAFKMTRPSDSVVFAAVLWAFHPRRSRSATEIRRATATAQEAVNLHRASGSSRFVDGATTCGLSLAGREIRAVHPRGRATTLGEPSSMSTWKIDPAHTDVSFSAKHLMITTVRGKFDRVEGEVVL
ncbi:MAG: YceI family protein, partial [Candidatus Limnocylindrales bacterium]